MRGAFILALVFLAATHLLLPWSLLMEARAIDPGLLKTILIELRLPRTLLVLGYGAALGISGAALQAVFANPLASPDISGASSGAALGAVMGSYWLGITAPLMLSACGAVGALAALALLMTFAGRRADSSTILLAGLGVSLAAGALTSLALALAPSPFAFYDSFEWLMGNFTDRSLPQAASALIPATMASTLLLRRVRPLDLSALGDDVMASLGVSPRRLTRETVLFSAIAVGACVSVVGAIGFVGLIAPVVGRRWVGGHPGRALYPAGLIGAFLMTFADLLVRTAPLDQPIPIGVVTAILGTPLFLYLVLTMRRRLTP